MTTNDYYAGASETTEGKVFTVTGQDWDSIAEGLAAEGSRSADERVVVNAGAKRSSSRDRSYC